jgi:hypothetical protein
MMIIGVDPHKSTHTATAVDPQSNRTVASVRIEASLADYRRLLRWAGQFDRRRWAIENAEGLGRHLSSCCWLAVRTWSTFGQPRPPEALLPTSRQQQLLLFCVRFVHPAMPSGSASRSPPAWSDQRTPRSFGEHPDQHRRHRRDHRRSSDRANRSGGPVPTAAAFANYAGAAPAEVASADKARHRLSRSGDRQLNAALHTVAITQIRTPGSRGHTYYNAKLAEGKTPPEARRCLKRRLANHIWRTMITDEQRQAASPGGHLGATLTSSAAGSTPTTSSSDKSLPGLTNHDSTTTRPAA